MMYIVNLSFYVVTTKKKKGQNYKNNIFDMNSRHAMPLSIFHIRAIVS